MQMFSHGVIAGLLFGVVGRMVYDRTHTRELTLLEGLGLARALPFAAVTFTLAAVASMGLPGFSGFVAELQVLMGTWQAYPAAAVAAGVGVVIAVAFTLRVLQKAFFGPSTVVTPEDPEGITLPEKLGAVLLLGTSLVVGLYPRVLLDWIEGGLASPAFATIRKVFGWS